MQADLPYTKEELAAKVAELGYTQPWNHKFSLPFGVETTEGAQVSHGKNLIKWERIKSILDDTVTDGTTVLDVGCNEGFFSFKLANMGATVLGIDADSQRIEKARLVRQVTRGNSVRFGVMDIYSEKFAALAQVDVCLCLGLLHRVPDPFSAIERLGRRAHMILFEWKVLKFGPHDEPFAYYTPGPFREDDPFATQYWVMSFACVEAILRRLGFDRFHRVDDPSFRRAILVAGRVESPVFDRPDRVLHRGRTRTLLSHTKRYVQTVGKILSGTINA